MDRSVLFGTTQERYSIERPLGQTGLHSAASARRRSQDPVPLKTMGEVAQAGPAHRKTAQDRLETRARLARKYDIRAITPREIDALAAGLSTEGTDAKMRRSLQSYGAEFRRNLANVAWQAGLTARPDDALEAHLDTALDLIEAIEDAARHPIFPDQPIKATRDFASWLHGFAALRRAQLTASARP